MPTFLDEPSRFLFFTGKGGVGKTALACATAIRLADSGKRVLLVSTDPASNLDEMMDVALSNHPTPVPGVECLWALNIDPEKAADEYRERVVSPCRGTWSAEQIVELREQLAGACTVEIAAFDEFVELLVGDEHAVPFEHVVFDTAPTGHTLRLLSLPRAWSGFLHSTTHGVSCLGPHTGLKMQETRFSTAVAALADAARTTIVLVARPDRAALREVDRTSAELRAIGIENQQLAINAVFTASDSNDPIARALEERGKRALSELQGALRDLPTVRIPLRPFNMVGRGALRALMDDAAAVALTHPAAPLAKPALPPLSEMIDEIAQSSHGLVMVMGKGGVGKTTIAAAVATGLAARGKQVHLSTTDPAAHIAATLDGQVDNLTVSRIDPAAELKTYIERTMATRGASLDDAGKALLAEDLRSPCYEEVAVFAAFSKLISLARKTFVVLDTAPTGHTLLLLDATGAYHRQATRASEGTGTATKHLVTPLMRLQDPDYTKLLIVTLAETTPVSEAAQLQADLQRAHIEPYAWVINSSLAAAGSTDPCLSQRVVAELEQIEVVRLRHAKRIAIVPWMTDEPVGRARLVALGTAAPSGDAGAAA